MLLFLIVEPLLLILYLPLLYIAVLYGRVESEITFPMTFIDDVYCLLEGELIEDVEHNVDSNISLIVTGVNYCSFWSKNDYLNHFRNNFEPTQENIISTPIPGILSMLGNMMERNNYPHVICDKIDDIHKEILIEVYLKYEDVIKRSNMKPVSLSNTQRLKYMTSAQISNELSKYLEIDQELSKYLNTVILNQEVSDLIKSRKDIFKYNPANYDETEINKIIQTIHQMYTPKKNPTPSNMEKHNDISQKINMAQ
ncbi:hypothetical protein Mpsy_0549 [Methanolobus psychrophilus R15]|nr:hypothetical protein Mpsy_0549 [Methanolobus psychrophilus R15]